MHAVCVQYMQNWLNAFYPDRMDLIEEMKAKASELGGTLEIPRLSWKYSWMKSVLGVKRGRTARVRLAQLKWAALRFQDRILFEMAKTLGQEY